MPRNARIVEVGVLAVMLALPAVAQPTMLDGVDYLMAVQCSAVHLARADIALNPYDEASDRSDGQLFWDWAVALAEQAKAAPDAAARDIAASKKDFASVAGEGSNAERRERLDKVHGVGLRTCGTLARLARQDLVIIGG